MSAVAWNNGRVYVPLAFRLDDDEAWRVVRDAGAGMLVVNTEEGLVSVFVPVVVSDDRRTIVSHLARANPWWKSVRSGDEVLGLFVAASSYVSPSYYPSRFEQPGVVPTWNYEASEVRGRLEIRDEPEWKRGQVRAVTDQFEHDRVPQWSVDDAPDDYVERQLKSIVGIEIVVRSIEGKSKLSQNRPDVDRESVATHLANGSPTERNVAGRMLPRE